jgi:hypothetical protein
LSSPVFLSSYLTLLFRLSNFSFKVNMMFRSFALFGGLALLSSAAAHHTVYEVQVSDSAGALVFEPPYIVSKRSVAFDHTAR